MDVPVHLSSSTIKTYLWSFTENEKIVSVSKHYTYMHNTLYILYCIHCRDNCVLHSSPPHPLPCTLTVYWSDVLLGFRHSISLIIRTLSAGCCHSPSPLHAWSHPQRIMGEFCLALTWFIYFYVMDFLRFRETKYKRLLWILNRIANYFCGVNKNHILRHEQSHNAHIGLIDRPTKRLFHWKCFKTRTCVNVFYSHHTWISMRYICVTSSINLNK